MTFEIKCLDSDCGGVATVLAPDMRDGLVSLYLMPPTCSNCGRAIVGTVFFADGQCRDCVLHWRGTPPPPSP